MKNIFFLFLLFCSTLQSQEVKKEIQIKIPKKTILFQVMNEKENEFLYFLSKKDDVTVVRFNESLSIKDSMTFSMPTKSNYIIEGYGIKDNKYFTYWTHEFSNDMHFKSIDFSTKKVESFAMSPKEIEGKIISRLTINDTYYIISIQKNTSLLTVHQFDGFELTKKNIDLSAFRFIDDRNKTVKLWNLLNYATGYESAFSLQTISQETPPSLPFSAYKRKLYIKENSMIFAFDTNDKFTQTFSINLNDLEVTQKVFNKPFLNEGEYTNTSSNSFVFENYIFLLKSTKERLVIDIKDFNDQLIKRLEAVNNVDIPFQNSEIIQESNSVRNRRVLGKSSQFLRKTSNHFGAISCYAVDDKIYMTLGGVSAIQADAGAAFIGGFMFGFVGGMVFSSLLTSNYSNGNLQSYYQRDVVYINSVFDRSFNHINEPIKRLPFDELRYFVAGKENEISTVFKFKNNLYYSTYEAKKGTLMFYEFKN
jgi:hypothetical protein